MALLGFVLQVLGERKSALFYLRIGRILLPRQKGKRLRPPLPLPLEGEEATRGGVPPQVRRTNVLRSKTLVRGGFTPHRTSAIGAPNRPLPGGERGRFFLRALETSGSSCDEGQWEVAEAASSAYCTIPSTPIILPTILLRSCPPYGGTSGAQSPDRPAAARGGGMSAQVGLRPGDGDGDNGQEEPRGIEQSTSLA